MRIYTDTNCKCRYKKNHLVKNNFQISYATYKSQKYYSKCSLTFQIHKLNVALLVMHKLKLTDTKCTFYT